MGYFETDGYPHASRLREGFVVSVLQAWNLRLLYRGGLTNRLISIGTRGICLHYHTIFGNALLTKRRSRCPLKWLVGRPPGINRA